MASGSSSRPTSVRGLYTPPAEDWVFLPPTVSPPQTSSSIPPIPTHLPTPFNPATEDDLPLGSGVYGPLQMFAAEYFTTAIGMPMEVGKTLLQIEYRPRRRFAPVEEETVELPDIASGEEEFDNPEEADMYFSDRLAASTALVPPVAPSAIPPTDSTGYFPDLHPAWLLQDDPDVSRGNGVWGMIRRIRYTPSEGLPGLWKGQVISTLHSLITALLQPHVHSLLLLAIPSSPQIPLDIPLMAVPNPALPLITQVASHLLTHLLLSPMELLRTRLIVMPNSHPSTPSSVTLFRQIINEEGGLSQTYFHPNLLIPSVLEHTIRPLLALSIPILLERQFGLSPELSPVTYSLCDVTLGLSSLLILLPIETVRKRLQVQPRERAKKVKTVVRTRAAPYVGVVEALWRITTEETGAGRKRVMSEKDEGGVLGGVRQLYRGFGMAVTTHLTVLGLGLVSASLGGRGFDSGWKEI